MINQKKLLRSDIRRECDSPTYEQGEECFRRGLVLDWSIKSEGALFVQITATVRGMAIMPYKQNIRIVWRSDFSSAEIDGFCSCTDSFNCKHIAAVCLKYINATTNTADSANSDCMQWLANLTEAPRTLTNTDEFIAYLLKPNKKPRELTVEFLITREKKTGGLLKGRKTTLNNLRYSYSYLSYMTQQDGEIAKLLSALNSTSGNPNLVGSTGYIALTKMLETGRLFWLNGDNPALTHGLDRNLNFTWQQLDNGNFALQLGLETHCQLILTTPPVYVDSLSSTIGHFNPPCPTVTQLEKLLNAPEVPANLADEFSQRLTMEHPQLPLPPPKKINIREISDLRPIPRLWLFGKQIIKNSYVHFMAVNFYYGEHLLSALTPQDYGIIKTDQEILRIQRDTKTEGSAISTLHQLGFTATQPDIPSLTELVLLSQAHTILESATRWGLFLHDIVPELKNQGWQIEIDDSFLLNFQTAHDWSADITESQSDWFEMHFSITVEGKSYPLLPLIMPVLEYYDLENLPELLSIPLLDHTYLNLPSERLKPFLSVLYELFNTSSLDKNGNFKLSRFDAATLAHCEEHSYGLFSITGGQALRELGQKLRDFSGIQTVALPDNFHAELRQYQQHGLNWLQFLREYRFSGILADDMGLGKTVQTLCHLLLEKQSGRMTAPCLIIAPTSLMSNWRREAERFTPDLKVLILQGIGRKQWFDKMSDFNIILTTYPLLTRDEEALLDHDYYYLILDEAQIVKNPLAIAAQLVRQVKCQHRLCLTGTPMENHLGELWAQFDFLMPGFLGNNADFKKRYRTPIENHGDSEQRQRLSRRIAPFMLRRTKQDVVAELPAKTEIIRAVPLHPKQAALYESIRLTMEQKVRDAIAQKGLSRSHITILDALLKLRQTCCDPRTLALQEAKKIQESAKLDLLMDMLPELLAEGRRVLVFSQFTRMIALIESELGSAKITYTKLTGQTKKRDEAINLFKSGEVNVFLISLKAGGVGLNLTEADTVIIYDPWWNPAAESQAADRAHRIGQDKPVFVYKLITENTVEEKILALQEKKRALAEGVYQSGEQEATLKLSADDLTALFEPL